MARRLFRHAFGAAVFIAGGVCVPGLALAAGDNDAGRRDLSEVYVERLTLFAAAARPAGAMWARTTRAATEPNTVTAALADVARVGDSELGEMRAGFSLPGGISLDFGFTSSTYLNGASDPVQTLNVAFSGSGSNYSGSATITSNGVTETASLTTSGTTTSVLTTVNNGLTSVQTVIGSSGLTTIVSNQANNQTIQQVQTLNMTTSGLAAAMSRQVTQLLLSNALGAANVLRGR